MLPTFVVVQRVVKCMQVRLNELQPTVFASHAKHAGSHTLPPRRATAVTVSEPLEADRQFRV